MNASQSLKADSKGHGEMKPEHLVGLQDKPDKKDKDWVSSPEGRSGLGRLACL